MSATPTRARGSRRRGATRRGSVIAGAVAALGLAVIALISFKANDGLPLQGSEHMTVYLPNADRLTRHDDVRIGGVRVGQVVSVQAVAVNGHSMAKVQLQLEPDVGDLATDTHVRVESASILGASYLAVTPGHAASRVRDGGTLPLTAAVPTVQLNDFLQIFDHASAKNIDATLGGLGPGLAARGPAIADTIAGLSRLLPPLQRVTLVLSRPRTDLGGFVRAADTLSGTLEPRARGLADLIRDTGTTADAVGRDPAALRSTIGELPSTEDAVTSGLAKLRPGLIGLARLSTRLRPAVARAPRALARTNETLRASLPPLRGLPAVATEVSDAAKALARLSQPKSTERSLVKLASLFNAATPLLIDLAAAQVNCNVIATWARNFSAAGLLGTGHGPVVAGVGVTTTGAQNEIFQNAVPSSNVGINYLPIENAGECESGNEPATGHQVLNSPLGLQSRTVAQTAPDPAAVERARQAGLYNGEGG